MGDFEVHTIKNELLSKQQALSKLRDQNHLEFQILQMKHQHSAHAQGKKQKHIKMDPSHQKKEKLLLARIQNQKHISEALHSYGLVDELMQTKVKVRLLSDLVDRYQHKKVKASEEEEKELSSMRQLYSQTLADMRSFVKKREKLHWRQWDHFKYRGGLNLALMIGEDQSKAYYLLLEEIERQKLANDRVEEANVAIMYDFETFQKINSEVFAWLRQKQGD
jgi:hypothetical protein